MNFISVLKEGGIARVTLERGKVNALNEPLAEKIHSCFDELEKDKGVRSIILTGQGKFFSFGLDSISLNF